MLEDKGLLETDYLMFSGSRTTTYRLDHDALNAALQEFFGDDAPEDEGPEESETSPLEGSGGSELPEAQPSGGDGQASAVDPYLSIPGIGSCSKAKRRKKIDIVPPDYQSHSERKDGITVKDLATHCKTIDDPSSKDSRSNTETTPEPTTENTKPSTTNAKRNFNVGFLPRDDESNHGDVIQTVLHDVAARGITKETPVEEKCRAVTNRCYGAGTYEQLNPVTREELVDLFARLAEDGGANSRKPVAAWTIAAKVDTAGQPTVQHIEAVVREWRKAPKIPREFAVV
jgi:hypothetical protein